MKKQTKRDLDFFVFGLLTFGFLFILYLIAIGDSSIILAIIAFWVGFGFFIKVFDILFNFLVNRKVR